MVHGQEVRALGLAASGFGGSPVAVAKSVMKARTRPQARCARGGFAAAPSAPAGPYRSTTERVLRSILLPLTDRRFEEGRLILVSL